MATSAHTSGPPRQQPDKVLNSALQARKISSIACQTCRLKKRKCAGPPGPCDYCKSTGNACVFDPELDNRRKESSKRKAMAEAEFHRDLLENLVDSLRHSSEAKTKELLTFVQSGASLKQTAEFLKTSLTELRESGESTSPASSELERAQSDISMLQSSVSTARTRRKVMSVNELADFPPYQVPAKPWTAVTEDDKLVSHLISVYFTWFHDLYQVTDRDVFLDAMRSGDSSSPYCSSFLVNGLCAIGALFSDHPDVFTDPKDRLSRGAGFLAAANELWQHEKGAVSLTNLQGLYALVVNSNLRGQDKIGWTLASIMMQMHRDLGLFRKDFGIAVSSAQATASAVAVRSASAWGSFVLGTSLSTFFLRSPLIKPPAISRFFGDQAIYQQQEWASYPRVSAPVPAYITQTQSSLNELCEHAWQLYSLLDWDSDDTQPESFEKEVTQQTDLLNAWHSHLPPSISLAEATAPVTFEMHALYHGILATAYAHLKSPQGTLSVLPATSDLLIHQHAQALSHSLHVAQVAVEYRRKLGFEYVPPTLFHACTVACHVLLPELREPINAQAFETLLMALYSNVERWELARYVLRLLQTTAAHLYVYIPAEINAAFKAFEARNWRPEYAKKVISMMPSYSLAGDEYDDSLEMGDLLRKWTAMEVGDREE